MNSVMKAWADLPPIFADRLMALLTAPGRIAHGLHRTNQLLLDADTVCEPHWLRPLRWAILYRYAVFDPVATRAANAQASAELWAEHFPAIHETVRNVSGGWEEEIAAAILADPFDRPNEFLPWQHALLDLDLGWIGATPAVYEAHRLLMMAEFSAAGGTAAQWDAARGDMMKRALAAATVFHGVHRERETAAKDNLRDELKAIVTR